MPRALAPLALLTLLLCLVPLRGLAADDGPLEIAVDEAAALAEALTGPEGARRSAAEAALAKADAALLRRVVDALRARVPAPAPAPAAAANPQGPLVLVETQFVRVSEAAERTLLTNGAADACGLRTYEPKVLADLLTSLPEALVVSAPTVAALAGQRADVQVLNQVSYVKDFEVEAQGEHVIASPVIGVVSEGTLLAFTARLLPTGVHLEAEVTRSELVRPIPSFSTTLAGGGTSPVTIQLPEVRTGGTQRSVSLTSGRPALLATLPSPAGDPAGRVLVFVTARVEPPPGATPPAAAPPSPAPATVRPR